MQGRSGAEIVVDGQPFAGPGDDPVRVSVLVLTFEHERYIARALEGVLEQDQSVSFEILVGDDASTDGTRAVIERYVAAHPYRIRTVFPRSNLGLAGKAMFQELLQRARGEYIARVDGDDHWTSPAKLRRQVAYLDAHPECSMCFHNVLWRHEDGSRPDVSYNDVDQPAEVRLPDLIAANPVASCSPVFRREAIHPLPAWIFEQLWGDWQLNLVAALHGEVHYLPTVMAVHLTHPKGMWSRLSWLEALEGITTCQEGMRGFVPPELEECRRRALADTWAKRAVEHVRVGEPAAARSCLRESFRVWPLAPRRLRRGAGEKRRVALWLELNVVKAQPFGRAIRRAMRLGRAGGIRPRR